MCAGAWCAYMLVCERVFVDQVQSEMYVLLMY